MRVNSPPTLILLKLCSSDTVDLGLSNLGMNINDFRNSDKVLVFVIGTPCVFYDVIIIITTIIFYEFYASKG